MKIDGKVHCFFEQSGTFKNEFKKLGIPAEDYDIQNNFGETDHVVDLFSEIEKEYDNLTRHKTQDTRHKTQDTRHKTQDTRHKTLFAEINPCQDLVIAFFPCIYFETMQMTYYSIDALNNRHKPNYERVTDAIERLANRTRFHTLLYKLLYLAWRTGFKLIIENPATKPNYLVGQQNFPQPTIIDKNRMRRGDYFKKPTAYWFFNCEPTHGFTFQNDKKQKIIKDCKAGIHAGICSEERSMISPDYARNFICDFILGKVQYDVGEPQLDFGDIV